MVWSNFGALWHLMAQNGTSEENLIDNVGHITKKMKNYEFKHANHKNLPILQ